MLVLFFDKFIKYFSEHSTISSHSTDKKEDRANVKPTIQILTQTPKLSQEYKQSEYTHHSRDMTSHSRDVTSHSRDVTHLTHDVTSHSRDGSHRSRDSGQPSRDITSHSRDVTQLSRDSHHVREISVPSSSQSTHSSTKPDSEKKIEHIVSEHSSQKQGTAQTTTKLTTTAPTICVRAVSKPSSSQPKPYIPYTTKVR